jgi:phospholipase C
MTSGNRRDFLRNMATAAGAGLGATLFPPAIRRALAIAPHRCTGTIEDVEHVVILMQENRSFDHYFGTLRGVRGFGDRFPIPVPDAAGITNKTVWYQPGDPLTGPAVVAPFHLDTARSFEVMRVEGTPHLWPDAQHAWADGKLNEWPRFKQNQSMGYFTESDIPFQFALAEAFTLCDAYHCSFQGGTNPNRLFLWTGTNDSLALGNGPAIDNRYDNVEFDPEGGYTWLTYCERLEAAGVSWQIYQNMDDNYTDNPVAGFRSFRDAYAALPGARLALRDKGLATRDLDLLEQDVLAGTLPQVSWVVATAEGSEHPGPSSPAQGADYTARVLDALTANPELWSKTVLLVNFDENDGFFDHVPPPAAPSYADADHSVLAGDSTVDTTGEYHLHLAPDVDAEGAALEFQPYGLGPRVPLYVISPYSKGGWVNSEVFDHTSVLRFLERRFGVIEPNISAWRRAVCGDLTSAFDFGQAGDGAPLVLPETTALADRARALPGRTLPVTPALPELPAQAVGVRASRPLPYVLHVNAAADPLEQTLELELENAGRAGACWHVYDRKHLDRVPRRYTVEPGKRLFGLWELAADGGEYDLWVLGPNGFHRHFTGDVNASCEHRTPRVGVEIDVEPEVELAYAVERGGVVLRLINAGSAAVTFVITPNAYITDVWRVTVAAGATAEHAVSLRSSAHWYDLTVGVEGLPGFTRRFAGRMETGRPSFSDPALGGRALGER